MEEDLQGRSSSKYLSWQDYLIFGLTLIISSLIGIYYAWRGKNKTTSDYLMGGKKMGIFPIMMSLAARYCFKL